MPTNGATGVAVDSNIDISFSEDVDVLAPWFGITCTLSGSHAATVSGGPASFTLDPDVDLVTNESCTVTVFGAQVTDADTDDPPDNMAADLVFSFTVEGDVPVVSPAVINEMHADPAADLTGDANGDGTRDSSADEFVEIANDSSVPLDMSGWTLSDGFGVRHTFPAGTTIPAMCSIVVFGGEEPTGTFGNAVVQTASSGTLGLNNTGDTVTLSNGSLDVASQVYGSEGGDDQSLTRDPDISGPFVKHSGATGAAGALFSPGTMVNGVSFSGCEPSGPSDPVINEFSASTTGTDVEYVEIFGEPNTDYSAYTVLEIEGDSSSNEGTIDEVISLGTTDASGFYLANLPANSLENGSLSLLLVKDFTGAFGDDLDTDDDGTIDLAPWTRIVDDVAVFDGGGGDLTYASVVLGPNFDGLSQYAPGGASPYSERNGHGHRR